MNETPPDGLARGQVKMLQVNPVDPSEPPVLFQYYVQYGDEGVVVIRSEGDEVYVPVRALRCFLRQFDLEVK